MAIGTGLVIAGVSLTALAEFTGRKIPKSEKEAQKSELQRDSIAVTDQETHNWKGYLTWGAASDNFSTLFYRVTTYVVYPLGTGLLAASIVTILTGNLVYITITIVVGAALGALRAHRLVHRERQIPAEGVLVSSSMPQAEHRGETSTQPQKKEDPKIPESIQKQKEELKKREEQARKKLEQAELEHKQKLEEIEKVAKQKQEEIDKVKEQAKQTRIQQEQAAKKREEDSKKSRQEGQQKLDLLMTQRISEIHESNLKLEEVLDKSAQQMMQQISVIKTEYDRQLTQQSQESAASSVSSSTVSSKPTETWPKTSTRVDQPVMSGLPSEKVESFKPSADLLIKILGTDINKKIPELYPEILADPRTKNLDREHQDFCMEAGRIKKRLDCEKDPVTYLIAEANRLHSASEREVISGCAVHALNYFYRLLTTEEQRQQLAREQQAREVSSMTTPLATQKVDEPVTVERLIEILGTDINKKIPQNYSEVYADPRTSGLNFDFKRVCRCAGQIQNDEDFQKDPKTYLQKLERKSLKDQDQIMAIEYFKKVI